MSVRVISWPPVDPDLMQVQTSFHACFTILFNNQYMKPTTVSITLGHGNLGGMR